MSRKYFGTDGVRGKVGQSPITPEFVMHLGYAAGKVLAAHGKGLGCDICKPAAASILASVWNDFVLKPELAALQARFPRCETLVNENTIDRWNAGQVQMLAVHPQSAGHGLNLQGQNKMVWLSLPWSLELYEQAVGRLHRSGQRQPVWNYVLLTSKTVDETIWKALATKKSVSEIAMESLQ